MNMIMEMEMVTWNVRYENCCNNSIQDMYKIIWNEPHYDGHHYNGFLVVGGIFVWLQTPVEILKIRFAETSTCLSIQ